MHVFVLEYMGVDVGAVSICYICYRTLAFRFSLLVSRLSYFRYISTSLSGSGMDFLYTYGGGAVGRA